MIPLAQYCERTDAGFWSEPFNATSNVAFLIAALWIARRLSRQPQSAGTWWDVWVLVVLAATVGVGSFLWHTLRTPWSQWADIIPILLFINAFLASFLVRLVGARVWAVLAGLLLFNVFNVGLQALLPAGLLNGSVFYLPTWIALVAIWLYVRVHQRSAAALTLTAVLAFSASLTFRTLDKSMCSTFPYGTHFAWHLLNGLVLFAVMAALVRPTETSPR